MAAAVSRISEGRAEVGPYEARDEGQWRTEIGWPIFHTGQTDNRATSSSGTS